MFSLSKAFELVERSKIAFNRFDGAIRVSES